MLASQSDVRRMLLANAGVRFEVAPARIDEATMIAQLGEQGAGHEAIAGALAGAKAAAVSARHAGALVIGADQLLVADGRIWQKAASLQAARERLRRWRGRTHQLVSGAVVMRDGAMVWRRSEAIEVAFRRFSDAWLDAYMAAVGEKVLATVGGYEIEGLGAQMIERLQGDYFAALGLPLFPLLEALRNAGGLSR